MTVEFITVGTAILQALNLFKLMTAEERIARRSELAMKERQDLTLSEKCFLFMIALEKMLGNVNQPETQRYLDGLELIGYPMEFIETVSRGESYPLAHLAAYLDEHRYEVYQLREQAQTLRSIDHTLKNLERLLAPMPLIFNDRLSPAEQEAWTDIEIGEIKKGAAIQDLRPILASRVGEITKVSPGLAERLKTGLHKINEETDENS